MATTVIGPTPISLTMDEYKRDWEPKGWRLIIIGPTSTWRQDWGDWEAIRDIVQNSLDEAEGYHFGFDDHGLWIIDNGRGVGVADFLLGPPKMKPDYARGKFGEGMKIATLALLRKGYPVRVRTVNREIWIIFLEQRVNGGVQTLAALWKTNGLRVGTEFLIVGYSGYAFEDRFTVNLPKSAIVAEVPSPISQPIRRYNQLIRYDFPPISGLAGNGTSRIYARDIYMRSISSQFSYNLWGFDMAPDRHAPKKEDDLWEDMGRLWCGVNNSKLLQALLLMVLDPPQIVSEEGHRVSMDRYGMGTEPMSGKRYIDIMVGNIDAWRSAWGVVVGKDAVLRTTPRFDGMVKHVGYNSQSVAYGVSNALREVIMTDAQLIEQSQESLRELQIIPDAQLTRAARTHLGLARAIASSFSPTAAGRAVPVHAAIIPPASERARTAGLYDMSTQEIMLHLETLEKARTTVDAMVHELGHHIALIRTDDPLQAEDLQPAHSEAMTFVAAKVWENAIHGEYDGYLQGAVW